MTEANRQRLAKLVAASTKLDTAARLVKEATIDFAIAGLSRESVQKTAAEIDAIVAYVARAIEEIPSS